MADDKELIELSTDTDKSKAFVDSFSQQSEDPYDQLKSDFALMFIKRVMRVKEAIDAGEPTIAIGGNCVPEVLLSMDLESYQFLEFPLMEAMAKGPEGLHEMIDKSAEICGPTMCTFVRLAALACEANLAPIPAAVIGMTSVCEAGTAVTQLLRHNRIWGEVPAFNLENPSRLDDRSLEFIARQFKEGLLPFLEKHTGRKFDMDRLKEICEVSNEQLQLWWEYNELRRSIPCPSNWTDARMVNQVARYWGIGYPESTEWLQRLIAYLEQQVKEGKGVAGVEKEKIRLYWCDFPPIVWGEELFSWLGKEFGVVMIMDLYSDNPPHTMVDTSNEETMWMNLAKRSSYDFGMPRIASGSTDSYRRDTIRVVKDFSANAVVWPGHMGHKDAGAIVDIVSEQCRKLGVPFMSLGCDLVDDRYVTVEEMKEKFSRFFYATGLA